MELKIGDPAPTFSLPDQNGENHSLENLRGSWVVLFFYPKDDTPGCTKEACGFRDRYSDIEALNVKLFGISIDPVESHKKFEEKYGLPFTLLADVDKEVVSAYDSYGEKTFAGNEYEGTFRHTFLINPEGAIAKIYEQVKPDEHAQEVIADLKALGA